MVRVEKKSLLFQHAANVSISSMNPGADFSADCRICFPIARQVPFLGLTSEQMFIILVYMTVSLNESVSVGAVFSRGTLKPVWFSRKGKQIRIEEVALVWKTREGSTPILHFSVTDGQGLYELRYNTGTLSWRLAACA
jgi:hypothetical protein